MVVLFLDDTRVRPIMDRSQHPPPPLPVRKQHPNTITTSLPHPTTIALRSITTMATLFVRVAMLGLPINNQNKKRTTVLLQEQKLGVRVETVKP